MSLETGKTWVHQDLTFTGLSLSGIRTAVSMPEFSLSFDVAQGFPYLMGIKNFFITHGHLDHAAGIPYIISQKSMTSQNGPRFYMPPSLIEPMHEIMKQWMKIEDHTYNYTFHPVVENESIQIDRNHFIKPFRTVHRVESFGYTVFNRRTKLKKEYLNLPKAQIIDLRKQGVTFQDEIETALVSFTGDTQIEFLDLNDWVKKSKILFLEATYLDERKSVGSAREWGHTHLDEIIPRLDEIQSERIVIIHVSSRYSTSEAMEILNRRIPQRHKDRVILFPGR